MKRFFKPVSVFLAICLLVNIFAAQMVTFAQTEPSSQDMQIMLPGDTSQMFAWWKLDSQSVSGSTYQTKDETPTARATIDDHNITVANGKIGQAFTFNGTDSYVKVNNAFTNVSQITPTTFLHPAIPTISVAFWIKPESLSGQQVIYKEGGATEGLAIGINNGSLQAVVNTGTLTQVLSAPLTADDLDKWLHAAVVFDQGTAKAYVNGELKNTVTGLANQIPQTLDCTELGASLVSASTFGWTGPCYYNGLMDDLRIYKIAVAPQAAYPASGDTVNLQCADKKNFYVYNTNGTAAVSSRVDANTRQWVKAQGLADAAGVSFQLASTGQYLMVSSTGAATVGTPSTDPDKQAATFYQTNPLYVPGWGEAASGDFHSYVTYDRSRYLCHLEDLSLTAAAVTADAQKAQATFKDTGDQTNVITGLKGAVYYPSYAYNAPQFWRYYDSAVIERDMQYAKSIGINAYRIWVSYEYWKENPDHFKAAYDDFLAKADANGIKILVSLFEGCDGSFDYSMPAQFSRDYSQAWSVSSPSVDIVDNTARWHEPEEFVQWFFDKYKDDDRQMAIEIYNEPWGDDRIALAKDLLKYAVNVQGSVPVSIGTTDGLFEWSTDLGVDIIQYHDNFPGAAQDFINNANAKMAMGQQYNLPVYCTEVQRVTHTTLPDYKSLASTCQTLAASGKWAPFYWSLMVHPCYLYDNRGISMINGIFQEDGSVWSIDDTKAIAGDDSLSLVQNQTSPYTPYVYRNLFSDDFTDSAASKWTVESGSWTAAGGQYTVSGSGAVLADLTDFSNFALEADVTVNGGYPAGLLFRASDNNGLNGYFAQLDPAGHAILSKYAAGQLTQLASADTAVLQNHAYNLRIEANGGNIKVLVDGTQVLTSDDQSYTTGQIGLSGAAGAGFANLLASVSELQNPVADTPALLQARCKLDGSVSLSWSAVGGTASYTVYKWNGTSNAYEAVADSLTQPSYVDTAGTTGSRYVVTAVNANGESSYSAAVTPAFAPNTGVDSIVPDIDASNGSLWYKFDEAAGSTAVSNSLYPEHPALAFGGTFVPGDGKDGGAMEFNGKSDSVQINNDEGAATDYFHAGFSTASVTFWMCPYKLTGNQMLFKLGGDANGISIRLSDSKLQAGVVTGDATNPATQFTMETALDNSYINRWTRVTLTFDNGAVKLYVDGSLKVTGTAKATSVASAKKPSSIGYNVLAINAFRDSSDQYYNGMMDDVRVYNTVIVPETAETVSSVGALGNIEVPFGTAADTIAFPSAVFVKASDAQGNTEDLNVSAAFWTCATYNASAAGEYTFTAGLSGLPENVTNPDGLKAQVKVVVKAAVKTNLQDLYDATKDRQQQGYTENSWSNYTIVLNQAEAVLNNAASSQADIDSALANLNAAIVALTVDANATTTTGGDEGTTASQNFTAATTQGGTISSTQNTTAETQNTTAPPSKSDVTSNTQSGGATTATTGSPSSPETGDTVVGTLLAGALVLSLLGVLAACKKKKLN